MSVWISVFSKEKVCHENWCPYARRIRYKNREKMSEERAVPPAVVRRDGVPAGQGGENGIMKMPGEGQTRCTNDGSTNCLRRSPASRRWDDKEVFKWKKASRI